MNLRIKVSMIFSMLIIRIEFRNLQVYKSGIDFVQIHPNGLYFYIYLHHFQQNF